MCVFKFEFHPAVGAAVSVVSAGSVRATVCITGTHPDTAQLARFSRRFLSRTRPADQ
jgi:hypothetical protein